MPNSPWIKEWIMRDTYFAQRTWQQSERKAQTDFEANLEWFVAQGKIDARRARKDSAGLTDEQIATARFAGFSATIVKHEAHVRSGNALALNETAARLAFESGWIEVWNNE
jgi:hypothetical protein